MTVTIVLVNGTVSLCAVHMNAAVPVVRNAADCHCPRTAAG